MNIQRLLSRFQAPLEEGSTGGGVVESPAGTSAPGEAPPGQTESPGTSADAFADDIARDFGYEPPEEPEQPTGAEPGKEPGETPAAEGDPEPAAPAEPALEYPSSWKPDLKEKWATLPKEVQEEVLRREQNFHDGVKQYQTAANVGNAFTEICNPYLPHYQQAGANIYEASKEAMRFHATLAFGTPEQKTAAIHEIAARVGFDLGQLGQGQPNGIPPVVSQLMEEVQTLRQGVTQVVSEHRTQAEQRIESEIMEFANAKDPEGNVANPYFWEVAKDMQQLFVSGQAKNLKEAYEKAVWLNPATRTKAIQAQQKAQEAKARREAQARAEKARKATSANVRSIESPGRATPPVGSIDETLEETLRAINSRG